MSDKPEGPGWWIASDGQWYPPELHPSVRDDSTNRAASTPPGAEGRATWSGPDRRSLGDRRKAAPGPEGTGPDGSAASTTPGSTWSGPERRWQGDRRKPEDPERVGPQFPDLFQKALQGSHLADNVSVRYDDDRDAAGSAGPAGSRRKVGSPTAGSTGDSSGSAVKRRWRKGS